MVRIDVTTQVSRPVQEVWDYFTDLTHSPHWTRSGSELRPTSAGPLAVGTTIESVRPVLGRELRSQRLRVTQFEPARLVSFTADVALLGHLVGGFSFEDMTGNTRLSRWTELEAGGLKGRLLGILAPLVQRSQGIELSNLKRLIERLPGPAAEATADSVPIPAGG